jgi:hypothetical protein
MMAFTLVAAMASSDPTCDMVKTMYKTTGQCCGKSGDKTINTGCVLPPSPFREDAKAAMQAILTNYTTPNRGYKGYYSPSAFVTVSSGSSYMYATAGKRTATADFKDDTLIWASSSSKHIGALAVARMVELGYIAHVFEKVRTNPYLSILNHRLHTMSDNITQPDWTWRDFMDDVTGIDRTRICTTGALDCTLAHNEPTWSEKLDAIFAGWDGRLADPVGYFSYGSGTSWFLGWMVMKVVNGKDGTSKSANEVLALLFPGFEFIQVTKALLNADFSFKAEIADRMLEYTAIDSSSPLQSSNTVVYGTPYQVAQGTAPYLSYQFGGGWISGLKGTDGDFTNPTKAPNTGFSPITDLSSSALQLERLADDTVIDFGASIMFDVKTAAKYYAMIANGGRIDGNVFVSPQTLQMLKAPNPNYRNELTGGKYQSTGISWPGYPSKVFKSGSVQGANMAYDTTPAAAFTPFWYFPKYPIVDGSHGWGGFFGTKFYVYPKEKISVSVWWHRRNEGGGNMPDTHTAGTQVSYDAMAGLVSF